MRKTTNPPLDDIGAAVGNLYSELVERRKAKDAERKQLKKEKDKLVEDEKNDEFTPLTKAEKRQRALDSWNSVLVNLTGEDLQYIKPANKKRKYNQWIDDDTDTTVKIDKPKKRKKKNYSKEFQSELSMLRGIVADQNKFTADLAKRFQNMVGPTTKESNQLSKTAVELAAAVNSSRSNSLSMIREIGNIKRTIADLTMKEAKEFNSSDSGFNPMDMTLMGSELAKDFINPIQTTSTIVPSYNSSVNQTIPQLATGNQDIILDEFDPNSWNADGTTINPHTKYENVSTKTVVEYNRGEGIYRFKTFNTNTNEELTDYPNPPFEVKAIDETNSIAKDSFDNIYELKVI